MKTVTDQSKMKDPDAGCSLKHSLNRTIDDSCLASTTSANLARCKYFVPCVIAEDDDIMR